MIRPVAIGVTLSVIVLGFSGAAAAQSSPGPAAAAQAQSRSSPTATDLNAAYCLGVINQRLQVLDTTRLFTSTVPGSAADAHQRWVALAALKDRLTAYLTPRLPHLEGEPMRAAVKSGADDTYQAVRDSVRARCGIETNAKRRSCDMAAAGQSPAAQRLRRCDDLAFLPP